MSTHPGHGQLHRRPRRADHVGDHQRQGAREHLRRARRTSRCRRRTPASGVASLEYRMGATGDVDRSETTRGAPRPSSSTCTIAEAGERLVQYRATDKSGQRGRHQDAHLHGRGPGRHDGLRAPTRGGLTPWKPDAHPGAPRPDGDVALRHAARAVRRARAQPLPRAAGRRPPDRQRAGRRVRDPRRAARRSPTCSTSRASGRSTASSTPSRLRRHQLDGMVGTAEVGAPPPGHRRADTTATVDR